jgi:16S rRNA A1518/A1519 N6-dimethyltransferase RsmA/KsgA/DIM1 with predicted DNA glycosylase/AP lyase activity
VLLGQTAIEIDRRAVRFLGEKLPGLNVIQMDVLDTDWAAFAAQRQGRLNIIGNLPYNISSQIMFSLIDQHLAIHKALFTAQLEVARRIVSKPRTKEYGILSVAFQLYAEPSLHFTIPANAFFPVPKVTKPAHSLLSEALLLTIAALFCLLPGAKRTGVFRLHQAPQRFVQSSSYGSPQVKSGMVT